jgi:hypothetical protein
MLDTTQHPTRHRFKISSVRRQLIATIKRRKRKEGKKEKGN